jgi:hypothetical protein
VGGVIAGAQQADHALPRAHRVSKREMTYTFATANVLAVVTCGVGGQEGTTRHPSHVRLATVAVIAISAILTLIMTLRTPRRVAGDKPHQDHHSRSLTIA